MSICHSLLLATSKLLKNNRSRTSNAEIMVGNFLCYLIRKSIKTLVFEDQFCIEYKSFKLSIYLKPIGLIVGPEFQPMICNLTNPQQQL